MTGRMPHKRRWTRRCVGLRTRLAEPSQEELAKNPAGPAVQTGDVTRFGIYVVLLVLAMGTMTVGLERSLRRKPGNR